MSEPLPNAPAVSEAGLRQLEAWIQRRQRPDEPDRWYYVHPLALADKPPDYRVHLPHPEFEDPWSNVGGSIYATAFGKRKQGRHEKLYIRLAVTGGEDLTNSLIFTLPQEYRPLRNYPFLARLGDNGVAAINVNSDGRVVYVGQIVGVDGAVDAIRFDADNEGGWLNIVLNDNFANDWASFVGMMIDNKVGSTVISTDYFSGNKAGVVIGDGAYFFRIETFDFTSVMTVDTDGNVEFDIPAGKTFEILDASASPLVTYTG